MVFESGLFANLAKSRFKVLTKLSAMPFLWGLVTGVVTGFKPSALAKLLFFCIIVAVSVISQDIQIWQATRAIAEPNLTLKL